MTDQKVPGRLWLFPKVMQKGSDSAGEFPGESAP